MPKSGVPVTLPTLRRIVGVSVTFLCVFLMSCKETDSDKIADAQRCLDEYSQGGGDLSTCENYVEGIETPAANGIRCATGFIREGFGTAQSFIDAFEAIETVNANTVRDFLRIIMFDSAGTNTPSAITTNYNNISTVYGYCAASLAKGATIIATFSYLTNLLYKYECDNGPSSGFMANCNMNDTALLAAIGVGVTDSTSSTISMRSELGTMIVSTYTVSCSTSTANEQLCKFLKTAIDNAGGEDNKAQVGLEFLNVLLNPPS